MKKTTKKNFRLNVVVCYHRNTNPNSYRDPIHTIFRHLSWLHGLDYAIDVETKIFDKDQTDSDTITDILYLRSGKSTSVSLREFQKMVHELFSRSIPSLSFGVDIFYQNQAAIKLYPFPPEFYRPLNYPYVEFYKAGQKELFVHREAVGFEAIDILSNAN